MTQHVTIMTEVTEVTEMTYMTEMTEMNAGSSEPGMTELALNLTK